MDAPVCKGNIRVGRITDVRSRKPIHPKYEGYTPIIVMTKSYKEWWPLSPYCLQKEGCIMENIWQFSKVYEKVPASTQVYSRWDNTVIWNWPEETHVKDGIILPAYWKWRNEGFNNKYAIRYPVGYTSRHEVLYSLVDVGSKPIDYIDARKQIYLPLYTELSKQTREFKLLKEKLDAGENLLIIEVDGPHEESLPYYKEKYRVNDDFIEKDTMLATKENLLIMLNDKKHPFGHGYCLASALLDINLC
jgi:hypothetical protein